MEDDHYWFRNHKVTLFYRNICAILRQLLEKDIKG